MKYLLLAGFVSACTLAAQSHPGAGSIAGHVFDSLTSAPIRKATVELTGSPTPASVRLVADTDAAGAFQFTGLPPGTYRLSAQRAGFLNRPLRRVFALGSDEHVADAEIRLPPQGLISGRVLDDEGDPEPGALVIVFKQVYHDGRKQWDRLNNTFPANDVGEYRVPNLVPGRYILQAMVQRPQPDNHYGGSDSSKRNAFYYPVYFQSASAQREALPVDVGLGAEVRGIDIRLFKLARPPSVHVRGKIVGLPSDSPIVVGVSLTAADETPWGGGSTRAQAPDYTFDLTAPPGQYTIRANVPSGDPLAFGAQSVALAGDVSGLALALTPAPVVPARIVLPEGVGPVKLQGLRVSLFASDALRGVYELRSDAAGKLAFPNPLWPGHYRLNWDASSVPDGWFVQTVRLAGQEISAGDFEILASAPLDIVLAKGAAKIAGSVLDKDDRPNPVSTVTLIPLDGKSRPEKVSADDAGNFSFTSLRPGKYKLFAWEEVDDDLWQDPEYRTKHESRATEVTVGPGETQNARVRVIAAEEMN